LYRACGVKTGRDNANPSHCDACFSGEYPVKPSDQIAKGFKLAAE